MTNCLLLKGIPCLTYMYMYDCRPSNLFVMAHSFTIFIFTYRQQIEDLEGKVKILKDQMKKKEENEAKYQGKGYPYYL